MSAPVLPRRGFLCGLATLPLIGGGVTLIGQPTAAAVPVTRELLFAYGSFCWWEMIDANNILAEHFDMPRMSWVEDKRPGDAKRNAAVVLSAVGGWRP